MHSRFRAILALVVLAATLSAASTASAAPGEEHCVIRVVGQRPSGELITTSPECRRSYGEALVAAGVHGAERLRAGASSRQLQAFNTQSTTFIIGSHYDGFSLTGSSISVVGNDCLGGYINLSSAWVNRVSSTANGCYRVKHWDGANKTGDWQETIGAGGNLSTLNNKADSIQYLS